MSSTLLMAKKRKQFSLSEKVDMLCKIEEGKKAVVAKEHGVVRSTIATIVKYKEKIFKHQHESQLAPSRLWLCHFQNIDAALLTWFKDVRAQNVPVPGPMLEVTSQAFQPLAPASSFVQNFTSFEASSGWLHHFRQLNLADCVWREGSR
ncbi:hypothetical protein HPB49_008152 [Dermacentor silvarum]|uniref:Uncharacterized protein n=1 Tax=Dermacentor silvarum TaxID=543639 RepID=A0ACB8D401_DERSI|nr:hypothetical protein HPB49_008152 [Dermacentor silvarum]